MESVFLVLTGFFAVATLVIVLTGILGMAQGGAFNKRYGNKLMRMRVLSQGLTIGCVFLYVLIRWMER